jgi:hypothetical protein
MTSEKLVTIGCSILILVVVVAFGIAEAVLYSNGTKYTPATQSCPDFPKSKSKLAVKFSLFSGVFHNHLSVEKEHNTYIQLQCPSIMMDNEVYSNDQLLTRTRIEPFSVIKNSVVRLNDCHGDRLYTIKTGDLLTMLKDRFTLKVSMGIWDSQENELLAYVQGKNVSNNKYHFTLPQGITSIFINILI